MGLNAVVFLVGLIMFLFHLIRMPDHAHDPVEFFVRAGLALIGAGLIVLSVAWMPPTSATRTSVIPPPSTAAPEPYVPPLDTSSTLDTAPIPTVTIPPACASF